MVPHDPADAPQPWPWPPLPPGLWPDHCTDGPEQYDAYDSRDIRADPVLRIHLRHMAMEGVRGHRGIVTNDGVSVRVDAAERTVLQAVEKDGRSRAYHATSAGLWTSLDLHAFHHAGHDVGAERSLYRIQSIV